MDAELLGGHFFGFAFLPHELQLALGFLEGGRDFLLHAGSDFFEFLRELICGSTPCPFLPG